VHIIPAIPSSCGSLVGLRKFFAYLKLVAEKMQKKMIGTICHILGGNY
jgi:hypothetical protein